jgi:hypothetical protein
MDQQYTEIWNRAVGGKGGEGRGGINETVKTKRIPVQREQSNKGRAKQSKSASKQSEKERNHENKTTRRASKCGELHNKQRIDGFEVKLTTTKYIVSQVDAMECWLKCLKQA